MSSRATIVSRSNGVVVVRTRLMSYIAAEELNLGTVSKITEVSLHDGQRLITFRVFE